MKVIENKIVEVKAGARMLFPNGDMREVRANANPEFAPFELQSQAMERVYGKPSGVAVKIEITGRTFIHKPGNYYVTARVTTIVDGDGEPQTFSGLLAVGYPGNLESAE